MLFASMVFNNLSVNALIDLGHSLIDYQSVNSKKNKNSQTIQYRQRDGLTNFQTAGR